MIRLLSYIVSYGIIIAAAMWGFGLAWFIVQIPTRAPAEVPTADAIVVLTGGKGRIEVGLDLLARGRSGKLLISGVGQGVQVEDVLRAASRSVQNNGDIVLGYEATNTKGNAAETAQWMQRQGYTSALLVTSSYHMPRSLLELRHAMPEAVFIAYPVFTQEFVHETWWQSRATTRLILLEYHKYLAVSAHFLVTFLQEHGA